MPARREFDRNRKVYGAVVEESGAEEDESLIKIQRLAQSYGQYPTLQQYADQFINKYKNVKLEEFQKRADALYPFMQVLAESISSYDDKELHIRAWFQAFSEKIRFHDSQLADMVMEIVEKEMEALENALHQKNKEAEGIAWSGGRLPSVS